MQWILGIALAAAVFVILKRWGALTAEKKKAAIWKVVLVVGGALLVFMVLTGRVHVLTAAVAAVIPLLRKLPALLKCAPVISRLFGAGAGESARADDPSGHSEAFRAPAAERMSVREACDILGVREDCPEDEIIMAHRRLIQKLHPDRGGNDYLAAKLNEAKEVLLARRKT